MNPKTIVTSFFLLSIAIPTICDDVTLHTTALVIYSALSLTHATVLQRFSAAVLLVTGICIHPTLWLCVTCVMIGSCNIVTHHMAIGIACLLS